jgi:hypothetical protein
MKSSQLTHIKNLYVKQQGVVFSLVHNLPVIYHRFNEYKGPIGTIEACVLKSALQQAKEFSISFTTDHLLVNNTRILFQSKEVPDLPAFSRGKYLMSLPTAQLVRAALFVDKKGLYPFNIVTCRPRGDIFATQGHYFIQIQQAFTPHDGPNLRISVDIIPYLGHASLIDVYQSETNTTYVASNVEVSVPNDSSTLSITPEKLEMSFPTDNYLSARVHMSQDVVRWLKQPHVKKQNSVKIIDGSLVSQYNEQTISIPVPGLEAIETQPRFSAIYLANIWAAGKDTIETTIQYHASNPDAPVVFTTGDERVTLMPLRSRG